MHETWRTMKPLLMAFLPAVRLLLNDDGILCCLGRSMLSAFAVRCSRCNAAVAGASLSRFSRGLGSSSHQPRRLFVRNSVRPFPYFSEVPSQYKRAICTMTAKGFLREYDDVAYWDKRYIDEGDDSFDWYQHYEDLKPLLHMYIPKNSRTMMAGCGNAGLSEKMVRNGYKEIVNIDISSIVIKTLQHKHRHIHQLTYMTLDVRDMSVFGDNSFDAVIDKGLLDSLLCGNNGELDVTIMLEEIRRILKPGGVFMLVTYGEPSLRMQHLKDPAFDWKVILHITPKPGTNKTIPASYTDAIPMDDNWECESLLDLSDPDLHFVYICTKEPSLD